MTKFLCEECWHEQHHTGFCEECLKNGDLRTVASESELLDKYADITPPATSYEGNNSFDYMSSDADLSSYSPNGSSLSDWHSWGQNSSIPISTYIPPKPPKRARAWRNNNFWFIGDVHNNIAELLKSIDEIRAIDPDAIVIQVGDIGNVHELPKLGEKDFFIQGNHDPLKDCLQHPNFLGKFGYKHGVFFLGGAESNGMGYKNEELTDEELAEAVKLYETVKPEIVVTHDLPESIREDLYVAFKKPKNSRTALALEQMWQIHGPNVWACGHFHSHKTKVIDGTSFIVLSPLESHQIQLSWTSGEELHQKLSKPLEPTKMQAVVNYVKNIFS